jgi:uncharacterized membrane protein YphA (DoxX/SURF4 family)
MLDWLLCNLFLLAVILIGAGLTFVSFSAVQMMHLGSPFETWAFILAAIATLVGTGYATRWLHGFIGRFM